MQADNQNVLASPEPVKVNENPPSTPINQYNQVSAQAVPMPPEPQPVHAPVKTEVPVQPVVEEKVVEPNKTTTSFGEILAQTEQKEQMKIENKKNNKEFIKRVLFVVLICFLSSGLTILLLTCFPKLLGNKKEVTTVTTQDINITEDGLSSSVEKVYDSVVIVKNYKYGYLYATGTGFVYKQSGDTYYLLTNFHVIKDATQVKIVLTTGDEYEVKVIGSDQYADIAVMEYKSSKQLKVMDVGDNTKSKVGDTVFAIGAPLDSSVFSWSVTRGVLSGKDRQVAVKVDSNTTADWIMNVIQTDAAINSGNSGGPLCNVNGEVIGITNMKLSDTGIEGMGFAIPIEDATFYADAIINGEDITRPVLGIAMYEVKSGSSYRIEGVAKGVGISRVFADSPAERSHLMAGDVIVGVDNVGVTNIAELRVQLYKHKFGDKVNIKYVRSGQTYTTQVELFKYTG
jgi:serine protease Do